MANLMYDAVLEVVVYNYAILIELHQDVLHVCLVLESLKQHISMLFNSILRVTFVRRVRLYHELRVVKDLEDFRILLDNNPICSDCDARSHIELDEDHITGDKASHLVYDFFVVREEVLSVTAQAQQSRAGKRPHNEAVVFIFKLVSLNDVVSVLHCLNALALRLELLFLVISV